MASSVIGALRVNLGLDSAQFEKGTNNVRRHLGQMRTQFLAIASVGATLGTALAGVGGSAVIAAREIQRLSQVSNAAPETFQRWAAASETVGIEQEKLSDILKDTTDRVGDFIATGGGPMADFFENIAPKVGVTADQFARLSGPEALQLYVSSLEKAGASQAEMTFYMEALASDATLLLPLLRDNGAEMGRLGDRAQAVGAIMDDDTVAALSRARTAFGEVSSAMEGARNIIAAQLAPQLEALATALAASLQPGGTLRNLMESVADFAGIAARALGSLTIALGVRYVMALGLAAAATGTLTGALTVLRGALMRTGIGVAVVLAGELIYRLSDLSEKLGLTKDASYDAEAGTAALNAALGTFRNTAAPEAAASAIDIANANIKLAKSAVDAAEAEVAKRRAILATSSGRMTRGADTELSAALADLEAAQAAIEGAKLGQLRAVKEVAGSMSEVMTANSDAARELAVKIDATTEATGALGGAASSVDLVSPMEEAKTASDGLGSSFSSMVTSAVRGAESASEAFGRLKDSLLDMALDRTIGLFFDTLFSSFSTGSTGGTPDIRATLRGLDFGGARARGGPVMSGSTYLVGERGPELFTPGASGSITPNSALGGETTLQVNIVNNTGAQVTATQGSNGRLDVSIDQQVASSIRSGPQTRRAMADTFGSRKVTA